ncbi:bifunctional 2-polyprenyl-6-hydroxyphenol methylase/3-demethylubiquinol 3-O-methyltransferase UbiG [Paenibacillus sp. NFR01]|uniref:class I SAM-dependent methyltransferase n=1 Tax=Paenibacillus sp. NFR01 TaxID=1566279 RepID=UPI0008CDFABB|nr:class I SAM-dependent methyltransferase [Paenibacillus sp. NFR01]SET15292.1 Methyltransferase domain-containing protein [Paenibacillus sp. NFR01]
MGSDLFDAAVWEQAWKDDPKAMGNRFRTTGTDTTKSFDDKAVVFDKEVFSESGRQRAERIIGWLEGLGVEFAGLSVLDIGAASGGFAVPFADRGAKVTAVEPNGPLGELFVRNTARFTNGEIELVQEPFEDIDLEARGWLKAFDLVFVSMCPVVHDWESVERVIGCASRYCYISMLAGGMDHSLRTELLPVLTGKAMPVESSDMAYLNQLLYLKGYSYESIITRESKSAEFTIEGAIDDVMDGMKAHFGLATEEARNKAKAYLQQTYPDNKVVIRQGGRFGKVLIQLREQQMYSRAAANKI